MIPLPYGTDIDWLRYVVTSGRATIVSGGRTVEVVDPQVIDEATAAPHLSARRRLAFERFGIERFVRLTAAPAGHRTQAP